MKVFKTPNGNVIFSCESCIGYEPIHEKSNHGFCKRKAPRPVSKGDEIDFTVWPIVTKEDWCTEYMKIALVEAQEGEIENREGDKVRLQ